MVTDFKQKTHKRGMLTDFWVESKKRVIHLLWWRNKESSEISFNKKVTSFC